MSKFKEFWLREWVDEQPEGFLSGNTSKTVSYDVETEPSENAIHVIEHASLKEAQARFFSLKEKVLKHREAYGLDIFPNSDKLNENSTRESISAHMGRHMCDCFLRYIDEALKEGGET